MLHTMAHGASILTLQLMCQYMPPDRVTQNSYMEGAVHSAGHAIQVQATGYPLIMVTIGHVIFTFPHLPLV